MYELPRGIASVPLYTFAISFIIGTGFFIAHLLLIDNDNIVIHGFIYTVIALVVNIVVVLVMIALSFIHKEKRQTILLNTACMFINIPITALYLFILYGL